MWRKFAVLMPIVAKGMGNMKLNLIYVMCSHIIPNLIQIQVCKMWCKFTKNQNRLISQHSILLYFISEYLCFRFFFLCSKFFGSGVWCVVYTLWISTQYSAYSRIKNPSWTVGPKGCPETSVSNYHYSLHNSPEDRSSPLPKTNCSSSTGGSKFFWKGRTYMQIYVAPCDKKQELQLQATSSRSANIPFAAAGLHSSQPRVTHRTQWNAVTVRQLLRQVRHAGNINEPIQALLW